MADDGTIKQKLANRTKSNKFYYILSDIVRRKELSPKTKLRVYNAILIPLQNKNNSGINVMEMR